MKKQQQKLKDAMKERKNLFLEHKRYTKKDLSKAARHMKEHGGQ